MGPGTRITLKAISFMNKQGARTVTRKRQLGNHIEWSCNRCGAQFSTFARRQAHGLIADVACGGVQGKTIQAEYITGLLPEDGKSRDIFLPLGIGIPLVGYYI